MKITSEIFRRRRNTTSMNKRHGSGIQIWLPRRVSRWTSRLLFACVTISSFIAISVLVRKGSMKISNILPMAGAAGIAHSQATTEITSALTGTTSSTDPLLTVPTASYDGKWRPQIHFSPPEHFINDPNGLFIDSQGIWHQYYQYNPYNTVAGNQTWGHAISRDLYHWEVQPVALAPTNGSDFVFSGSAVVDVNNTSGKFPNQKNGVVAIFTTAGPNQQVQDIAFSYDDGYTFERFEGNPVLQVDSPNFRDPKVFWYSATQKWVMVVAFSQEFNIAIYTSPNLIKWEFASNWTYHGIIGYQYECPNLVQMPMQGQDEPMWLMYLSINPGAPYGGSIGQYFPGGFNGTHFAAVDAVARIADFGKDNYASQFWYGIPGDQPQISIAWASNWEYTNRVPTGPAEGWQSAFSLPRRNYLKNSTRIGYTLVSQPYNLEAVIPDSPLQNDDNFGNGTMISRFGQDGASGTLLLDVNITSLNVSASGPVASLNFTIWSSISNESLTGGQFFTGDYIFWLNRGKTYGFDDAFFTDKFSVSNLFENSYHLQVIVDRSILEAFVLDGEKSATLTYYPNEALDTIKINADQINSGAKVEVTLWELDRVWNNASNPYLSSLEKFATT